MSEIPTSIEAATEQAKTATAAALSAGLTRLQVEMVIPELKQQPIAKQFLTVFQTLGLRFKVYFPDAGAAALAKRDWENPDFTIRGINESQGSITPEDEAFLIVNPSAVEVEEVETLCQTVAERPVVLLNPSLEDVAIVGIGYAARQLRDRFLSTLETIYYLRPLEGAAVFRCYPQDWQVWQETAPDTYTLVATFPQRPSSETLDELLYPPIADSTDNQNPDQTASLQPRPAKRGLLSEIQQFIRALTQ